MQRGLCPVEFGACEFADLTSQIFTPPTKERPMKTKIRILVAALFVSAGVTGFAQTTASTVQRDVSQQQRIEQGLQNGQLTVREAGKLEHEESKIDKMQAQDLKDGRLSSADRAHLRAAQNKVSADIWADRANGVVANPDSGSSKRLQADVQRNITQDKRIEGGIQNGSLSNRQVGSLERGQAHVDHKESVAARNGHIDAHQQSQVNRVENRQSRRIYKDKHDAPQRMG
ncbi:hypothetical protein ACSFA8_22875 [Variovorax sp. RT4R15]|uniref:hypothetical protein n=1 Tax=Variovorax sp. RT4R15 TaxID=3443737 RepID=UPI003F459723